MIDWHELWCKIVKVMVRGIVILLLLGLWLSIALGIVLLCKSAVASAATYEKYLGRYYVSTYSAADNTPAGTRNTASGELAQEWETCAVDMHTPLVPLGKTVIIYDLEGNFIARARANDKGNFGRYNGGMRQIDLFVPVGCGFCKECVIYVEEETIDIGFEEYLELKAEKDADAKADALLKMDFQLVADETLPIGTIATDPQYIEGGTVLIGETYYEVTKTDETLGRVIKINPQAVYYNDHTLSLLKHFVPWVRLGEVIKEAKG